MKVTLYMQFQSKSGELQGQTHVTHRGVQKNSCVVYSLHSYPPGILPWKLWKLFIILDHTWPEQVNNMIPSCYSLVSEFAVVTVNHLEGCVLLLLLFC